MDISKALKQFGFTGQEALLYVTLLERGPLTGYEAAKVAGISRSNAYAALSGLVEKGGGMKSSEDTIRYSALQKQELVLNLRRRTEKTLEFLLSSLPEGPKKNESYFTISGRAHVENKMRSILQLATARVYVSMARTELIIVKEELVECLRRGLKTVVISDHDPQLPKLRFYHKDKRPGQVKIIADTAEVLTGSLLPEGEEQCLYSRNRQLVSLMRDAVLNEIELARERSSARGESQ